MEEGACIYNKYGYCKFKDCCKKTHYKEECVGSKGCKGAKLCHIRHPKACKRYNTDKGCQYGSDCAYKHTIGSMKAPHSDLVKKIELLVTLVIEMGNKMIKLEAEIKNIKSGKSIIITSDENSFGVKKDERIKDKTQSPNKPDQGVKDPLVAENKKESVKETEKETQV